MPTYKVTDQKTGIVLQLTGTSPPTEDELTELFDAEHVKRQKGKSTLAGAEAEVEPLDVSGIGVLEPIVTLATGAVAEPVAGLAGIAAGLAPVGAPSPFAQAFADEPGVEVAGVDSSVKVIEAVREGLTYQPKTAAGKEVLQTVGKAVAAITPSTFIGAPSPFAQAFADEPGVEKGGDFSDEVFNITGSPLAASIAATLPTAALELVGIKGVPAIRTFRKAVKKEKVLIKEAKKAVIDNAPDVEKLKSASQELYKSIENNDMKVKANAYDGFTNILEKKLIREGLDKGLTPDTFTALERLSLEKGKIHSLSEMSILRSVAQNAAGAVKKGDARLGKMIVDEIDTFLDSGDARVFSHPLTDILKKQADELKDTAGFDDANKKFKKMLNARTKKTKAARALYGRAKKSELINEAVENATLFAGGLESGLKSEFTKLLRNKKTKKFFKPEEIDAIKAVAIRPKSRDAARALGKLGYSDGNIFGTILGGTAFTISESPLGLAIPLVGEAAKKVTVKMAQNAAKRAQAAIASGKNADKIIRTYLRSIPKAKRSIDDLSNLLLEVDLVDAKISIALKKSELIKNAVEMSKGKKTLKLLEAISLAAPGALESLKTGEPQEDLEQ